MLARFLREWVGAACDQVGPCHNHEMRLGEKRAWSSLASVLLGSVGVLVACGDGGGSKPAAEGGAAGASGAGGQDGVAGSAGGAGSPSAGAGGTGAAGSGSLVFDAQPACTSPAVACNGACLDPGGRANGCAYLTRAQLLTGLTVSGGDAFVALGFPITELGVSPPQTGLYRIDGGTLELEPLDTSSAASTTFITVAGDNVYYMKPGTISNGFIRSVSSSGGAVTDYVTDISDGSGLWVRGDRLYFAARLDSSSFSAAVHWMPLDATADPQSSDLTSASRVRTNQTLVVASFNGNIKTAPLPDLSPVTDVMDDFALPRDQWWIDDQYIYWDKGGSYKRSPLTAVGATEAGGELVTSLPTGMSVQLDVGSELFLSATVDGVTGFFAMPITGGTPTQIGVLGAMGPNLRAADSDHLYVSTADGLLRLDR